jgi:transcriptional regulator with XRE-family HTH domain
MSAQATNLKPKLRSHDSVSHLAQQQNLAQQQRYSRGSNSLSSIAKRAGICRSHLFRILDGSRIPSLPVAWKLSQALRITLDELYSRLLKVKARKANQHKPETIAS